MMDAARRRCILCGELFDRTALGLVRTSSVRIAAGESDLLYASVDELPPDLRRRLQRALVNPNSETIVIADEQGRQEIFQVINGLNPDAQKKVLAAVKLAQPLQSPLRAFRTWRVCFAVSGLLVLVLFLWWVWK